METCGGGKKQVTQFYENLGFDCSLTHMQTSVKTSETEGKRDWYCREIKCMHTDDPWSTTRVRKAQGKPKPSRMSKILLPMELDTAMSPMPEKRREK